MSHEMGGADWLKKLADELHELRSERDKLMRVVDAAVAYVNSRRILFTEPVSDARIKLRDAVDAYLAEVKKS